MGCPGIQVWYKGWERNGFRTASGDSVKNQAIIKCIKLLLDLRALSKQTVRFEYVKGHSGHFGNDGADEMANIGATQPPEPERDWTALERRLRDEIKRKQQSAEPSLPEERGEHPTKMIKLAALFGVPEVGAYVCNLNRITDLICSRPPPRPVKALPSFYRLFETRKKVFQEPTKRIPQLRSLLPQMQSESASQTS